MTTFKRPNLLALFIALAIPVGVGLVAQAATFPDVNTWYTALTKPDWTAPDWIFGPIWALMYLLMGLASWYVWETSAPQSLRQQALGLYIAQLLLNGAWSFIFFTYHAIAWAFIDIILLWTVLALTTWSFFRIRPRAGWLLLPYLLWITYALSLNGGIVFLN